MARTLLPICLIGAVCSLALADRLVLVDGRSFTGTVTVEGNTVTIELPYGKLQFPRDQAAVIEFKETPEAELARMLGEADTTDPTAVVALAQWAAEQGLSRQAKELYTRVLSMDGENAEARRALGFVRIDGVWLAWSAGMELARSKLDAGQAQSLFSETLAALEQAAATPAERCSARELTGLAQLRAGRFAEAAQTFSDLSKIGDSSSARYAAIAQIVSENSDGMYVLREPYPPSARLLGETVRHLPAGPASLTDPLALQAAMRDRAKGETDVGRELMAAALALEATDPDAANAKYFQSLQAFDRADALVEGISRSYRVEVARRRIASIRRSVQNGSQRFDEAMGQLGQRDMAPGEYRGSLTRLIGRLDAIRSDLQEIMTLSRSYGRELVLESKWAEADLKKIEAMRKSLVDELSGIR